MVLRADIDSAGVDLSTLTAGAIVGTSSQRRLAQLKALRGDVLIKDLRGNVDTRLRKLDEGQYDALILASAGLRRLGLGDRISAAIPTSEMLPAVGQGAVAIEVRKDNQVASAAVDHLNHDPTRIACLAERSLLRMLGGGCQLPIAAYAVVKGDELVMEGLVSSPDGSQILRHQVSGPAESAEDLGTSLAQHLLSLGANSLLQNPQ